MEHEQSTGRAGAVYTYRMAGHQDELAGQDPGAYLHIYSVLARRIRDGEYPAGAKLPTETELAEEFGCGPGTAAQALRALQRNGLARKVPRKGLFSFGPDNHSR
jgi:DNA-binding GntR family transcriptional regulator